MDGVIATNFTSPEPSKMFYNFLLLQALQLSCFDNMSEALSLVAAPLVVYIH